MTYGASTLGGAAIASTTGSTRAGTGTAAASTTTASQATGTAEAVTVDDTDSVGYYGGATLGGAALGSVADADAGTVTSQSEAVAIGQPTGGAFANASAVATTAAVAQAQLTRRATATTASTTITATTTSAGKSQATASATTSASLVTQDAATIEPIVEWRVTRDQTEVIDRVFDVDPVVDTANPFGDYAVFKADDSEGDLFGKFPRGTRVDIAVSTNGGITYENKFTGYTVERRENEQSGADVLEVEAYSFDQFLRRNTVSNDQTGNTIAEALEDIVKTDTPVTFDATNVEVGDEQSLTRAYEGENVETVLRDLAFKSNNEDFGVNDSLEFFFRERETTHIDRGIDDTQWFNYDLPELGKEAINEVEVWFDDGEESVIIDDGTDKLDLQDNLGLPDPGTQRAELNRPLITDINDAEDIGRKYLAFRNATLSGTVTTFGLYDAEPGDTIDITIDARGIDAEFVIAAVEYRWGVDQTILTIIEKRGDVDDILTDISDSVQRVEMNGANRDAPKNRITSTNATGIVSISADADGNTPDADRFVNDGRRAVRDSWVREDSPPDITTLVVGSDGSGLSRSNTALRNQTNSATVSQNLPNAKTVEFSASITQTGVQEIGLEAADGTLITRATFDTAVDFDGTVTVTLTVNNDTDVSRGVVTDTGQTEIRNILADNQSVGSVEYAYGSDGAAVSESDTALGNELVSQNLDQALIKYADTQTQWDKIIDQSGLPETVTLENGTLRHLQSSFIAEAENNRLLDETIVSDNAASDGEALALQDDIQTDGVVADTVRFEFTNEYEITEPVFYIRWRCDGTPPVLRGQIDGTEADARWDSVGINYEWEAKATSVTLQPGTHEVRLIVDDDSPATDPAEVDLVYIYDNSNMSATFDDSVNSPGGYLDGPELYSDLSEVAFEPTNTRRELTSATARQTWNDTSNAQFIELSNDGGSTFLRTNNNDTATGQFANPSNEVIVRVGISRFGQSGATPLQGANGQEVSVHDLRADVDAITPEDIGQTLTRAVIPPDTITGDTIREAGIKFDGNLLTHHVLAEFDVLAGQRISSSETTLFTSDN